MWIYSKLVVHLTDINYTFFFYLEGSLNLIGMTFAVTKPMLLYLRALGLEHANLEGEVLCSLPVLSQEVLEQLWCLQRAQWHQWQEETFSKKKQVLV